MTTRAPISTSSAPSTVIDVWTFALDVPETAALGALLSADERQRANRLQHPDDAARFSIAHGRLREILASYLHIDPALITFGVDGHEKPFIASPETPLRFNLSHSGDLAAIAVSRIGEVGIDIERIRILEGPDLEPMFSASEQASFAELAGGARREAFFRCWTRKEALLKAWGRGLDVPLDSFDVPVGPKPDVVVRVADETGNTRDWRLISFTPQEGYAGTLAVAAEGIGRSIALDHRAWPPAG